MIGECFCVFNSEYYILNELIRKFSILKFKMLQKRSKNSPKSSKIDAKASKCEAKRRRSDAKKKKKSFLARKTKFCKQTKTLSRFALKLHLVSYKHVVH
jgi:hypothetical protein